MSRRLSQTNAIRVPSRSHCRIVPSATVSGSGRPARLTSPPNATTAPVSAPSPDQPAVEPARARILQARQAEVGPARGQQRAQDDRHGTDRQKRQERAPESCAREVFVRMDDEKDENADQREHGERQEVDECACGEQTELAEIMRGGHLRHPATDGTDQPAERVLAASRGSKDHRQPHGYVEDAPRVAIGGELIDDEQRGVRHVGEPRRPFRPADSGSSGPGRRPARRRRRPVRPRLARGRADPDIVTATRGPGRRRAGQSAHAPARGSASPEAVERRCVGGGLVGCRRKREGGGHQEKRKKQSQDGELWHAAFGLVTHSTIPATRSSPTLWRTRHPVGRRFGGNPSPRVAPRPTEQKRR